MADTTNATNTGNTKTRTEAQGVSIDANGQANAPEAQQIKNVHAYVDNGKWHVDVQYQDAEGNTTNGETQTFDDFSQATAWVAGMETDAPKDTAMQTPPVDDTTKL